MPLVSAKNLQRSFGVRTILNGIDVSLEAGERVGLVGRNGSGKSTLAKLLCGHDQPDGGEVVLQRGIRAMYLEQQPILEPGFTARETVLRGLGEWSQAHTQYLESSAALERGGDAAVLDRLIQQQAEAAAEVERLGGWERAHEAEAILDKLGVEDPDAVVTHFSGGERRRVALARLLVARPDLAILDEPTNHLDVAAIEWLEQFLCEQYTGTVLLITHDRYVLNRVATRTLEIDQGTIYSYDGGYETYLEARAERLAHAQRTEQNRQNFLRRELDWLRRQPKARTGKQKARIQRIHSQVANAPSRRDHDINLEVSGARLGNSILELRDVDKSLGDRQLIAGLTLLLRKGERIGILGPNGCGKTTLLRTITGDLAPDAGTVQRGKNTKIAYLDQKRSDLDDSKTVYDNVADGRSHIELGKRTLDIGRYLERFLFTPHAYAQKVGSLSGGERARVALARILRDATNLVILDEPTNDLDTTTLAAVEDLLQSFTGSALVVTHDRWFLDRVATSILAFEGAGKIVHYQGNYSTYLRLKAKQPKSSPAKTTPQPRKPADLTDEPTAKPRKLTYAEKIELDGLMDRICEVEEQVAQLEQQLASPDLYATKDGAEQAQKLAEQRDRARDQAGQLTARWELLESLNDDS